MLTSHTQYNTYQSYLGNSDVSLARLIERLKHDPQFSMVVRVSADTSVGRGYYLSPNGTSAKSQTALEILENWCEENDFDSLVQAIAIDLWSTGNSFLKWTKDGNIKKEPCSEFIQVNVDDNDDVVSYRQQKNGQQVTDVPVDEIIHFAWQKLDQDHFGTGLGQLLERKGIGFTDAHGRKRRSPSLFEINEMMRFSLSHILWSGLPRWLVHLPKATKDTLDRAKNDLNKLDILQHLIVNTSDSKIDQVSLDPSNKYDSLLKHLNNDTTLGLSSPLPTLWKDMSSFAYASSESALESSIPQIDAFQRFLQSSIEKMIFKPILQVNDLDWNKHKVSLHWGKEEVQDIAQISDLVQILDRSKFSEIDWASDVIELLRDAGYEINAGKKDAIRDSIRHKRNSKQPKIHKYKAKSIDDMKKDLLRKARH